MTSSPSRSGKFGEVRAKIESPEETMSQNGHESQNIPEEGGHESGERNADENGHELPNVMAEAAQIQSGVTNADTNGHGSQNVTVEDARVEAGETDADAVDFADFSALAERERNQSEGSAGMEASRALTMREFIDRLEDETAADQIQERNGVREDGTPDEETYQSDDRNLGAKDENSRELFRGVAIHEEDKQDSSSSHHPHASSWHWNLDSMGYSMLDPSNYIGIELVMNGWYCVPPTSQEALDQHSISEKNVVVDLLNNVTAGDEEGRSRQRILSYAAKRYASAIERNPQDYDALYNWALVLQESADNVGPDSSSPSKDTLLEEACRKYDEATRICPTLHDAFYNWAIAISDRAKMRGRTKEAEELWKQATKNYERAVQLNWNSPQALNNWGLALQELSAIVPVREKQTIVRTAVSKFRAAIQLQFDFHRAIYNLGTVLYGLAEDTLRGGRQINMKETTPNELYSQSAIYIAAAHALRPNYSVYRSALRLVRSMLPLPYLKAGYLTAPPGGNSLAPHNDWKRSQFVLDHEGLYQVDRADQKSFLQSTSARLSGALESGMDKSSLFKVEVANIVRVSPCADLTLPPGGGICIDTVEGSWYLVADTWEVMDGWIDAIRLVYTIFVRGKSDVLAGVITG